MPEPTACPSCGRLSGGPFTPAEYMAAHPELRQVDSSPIDPEVETLAVRAEVLEREFNEATAQFFAAREVKDNGEAAMLAQEVRDEIGEALVEARRAHRDLCAAVSLRAQEPPRVEIPTVVVPPQPLEERQAKLSRMLAGSKRGRR